MALLLLVICLLCFWIVAATGSYDLQTSTESVFDSELIEKTKQNSSKLASSFVKDTSVDNSKCPQQNWLNQLKFADVNAGEGGSSATRKDSYHILSVGFNHGYNFASWLNAFAPMSNVDTALWYQTLKKVPGAENVPSLCGLCDECKTELKHNITFNEPKPPSIHFLGVELNEADIEAVTMVSAELAKSSKVPFSMSVIHGAAMGHTKGRYVRVPECSGKTDHCRVSLDTAVSSTLEEEEYPVVRVVSVGALATWFGMTHHDRRRRRLMTQEQRAAAMQSAITTNQRNQQVMVPQQPQRSHTTQSANSQQPITGRSAHTPTDPQHQNIVHQQSPQQPAPPVHTQQPPHQTARPPPPPPGRPQPPPVPPQSQQHSSDPVQPPLRPQRPGTPTYTQRQVPVQHHDAPPPPPPPAAPQKKEQVVKFEAIDLLHISTGGDELPILQSAFSLFEARRVRAVMFEYTNSTAWQETPLVEMVHSLSKYDLSCYFQGQNRLWAISGAHWNEQYEIRQESQVFCVQHKDPWFHAIQSSVVTVDSLDVVDE